MEHGTSSWGWLWRYVVGGAAMVLLGLRTYAGDHPFPPLQAAELGLHESSHWLTIWAPRVVYFMAGSVGQVAVPLAIAAYLWLRMRDPLGGAACLWWAGHSSYGVAVYIADAPYERLTLVGGNTHDWAYLLGPEQFGALDAAAPVAGMVRTAGIVLMCIGIAVCVVMPMHALRREQVRVGGLRWSRGAVRR